MKLKLLVTVAASLIGSAAIAQSAFEGFYGQIATGYESNSVSSISGNGTDTTTGSPDVALSYSASSQNFGNAPLVLGLGYNFSVAPKWLLGLGVDYSAISQTSQEFSSTATGFSGFDATATGASVKIGNRFNIFLAPSYEIDKDKLVYLKAGYSSVDTTSNAPTGVCINSICGSNAAFSQTTAASETKTMSGYVIGLGYKQMIAKGFYGFAEANYMNYGKATFNQSVTYTDGSGGNTSSISANLSSYQALVGIGYKF